jgi:hypothetical protein
MAEEEFRKVQIRLMKFYFRIYKMFGSKKTENQLELEFISKYCKALRKLNNFHEKLKR